ncbi:hypothetical protein GUD61_000503 [Salmonella enterica]|nr:hypothetical protein [Salmonella enterica]
MCNTVDISERAGISIYQAKHYLDKLVARGLIQRSPKCKGMWVLWCVK